MRRNQRREIFECPHCGADVPIGSAACKECGSDTDTGWQSQEEIDYQSLDLPEGYAAGQEGHPGEVFTTRRSPWFYVIAALLVLAMVIAFVLR